MTPLTEEQEEQFKEECRQIFYDGLRGTIQAANSDEMAAVLDCVRGNHRLLDVLYGWPTPCVDRVLIYPLRTYELIREYKAKEIEDARNSGSRDQQAEAIA